MDGSSVTIRCVASASCNLLTAAVGENKSDVLVVIGC